MPRLLLPLALALFPVVTLAQGVPAPPAPPALTAARPAPPPPAAPSPPPAPPAAPSAPAPPPAPEPPPVPAEVEAVRSAVQDYVLAFYEVAPERLARSLHPNLQKVGFYRGEDGDYHYATMTYEEALALAARWNREGRIPADAPREITIFEVNDQTAVAKLVAHWGVDYFHLGRYDGTWKIINVLWQSPPDSGR